MADKRRRERPAAEAPKVTPTDKPTLGESDSSKSEPINFQWVGVALILVPLLVVLYLYFTPSKVREMIYAAKTSTSAQVQPSQKVQPSRTVRVEIPANIPESPIYPQWGQDTIARGHLLAIRIPRHYAMCLGERPVRGGVSSVPIDTDGLAFRADAYGNPADIREAGIQFVGATEDTELSWTAIPMSSKGKCPPPDK
jgi:hypothetical protein